MKHEVLGYKLGLHNLYQKYVLPFLYKDGQIAWPSKCALTKGTRILRDTCAPNPMISPCDSQISASFSIHQGQFVRFTSVQLQVEVE